VGNEACSSLFRFGLNKCQVPTETALSLPLLNWTGERKYDERLKGQDKDRERSLTNYHPGQNRLNLGRKGNLIYLQSNQSRIRRNKIRPSNTFPLPLPSSWAQLYSRFSTSSLQAAQGDGEWGDCSQFITHCLCRSFLLRGRTPHTLPLLQGEVPLTGDSSPQTSPM